MATRAAKAAATPSGTPAFASPVQGPSLTGGPLRLARAQGPWTYMANPAKLGCFRGRIVPLLCKAWHEPGLNGNGRQPGRGEGFIARMQPDGWTVIPHDTPAVAFGAAREGCAVSTYLDRYEGQLPSGAPVVYYSEAWARPQSLGSYVHWVRDDDGRAEWLAGLLAVIGYAELLPVQVEMATQPLIRGVQKLANRKQFRDDGLAQRNVATMIRHLPEEYRPTALRTVLTQIEEAGYAPPAASAPDKAD